MGRTVSPAMIEEARGEFEFGKTQLILEMLNKGKRLPKDDAQTISVRDSLLNKTTSKARILNLGKKFAPEFEKFAGKKADTAKIFGKVIGRNVNKGIEISA